MTWLDEMAAVARDSMERYRCEVARMDLRATHAELRRVRRMNRYCRMDGRGDSDQRYKVEMLRARRDALSQGQWE